MVIYITSSITNKNSNIDNITSNIEYCINTYIIPRIGTDDLNILTSKLDNKITTFLSITDSTIDEKRVQFADALLDARSSIIAYTSNIYNNVVTKTSNIYNNVNAKKDEAVNNITTIVNNVPSATSTYATTTYATAITKINELKTASVSASYVTASVFLEKAQPFVKSAIERATPIVNKTHELALPYVTYAEPYVVPLINKAKVAIDQNSVTGPIVRAVVVKAKSTIAEGFLLAENYVMAQLVDHELTVDAFGQD
jgi:hypothetical protein